MWGIGGRFYKRILGVTVNKKTVRSLILSGTEAFRQIISSYFNKTSGGWYVAEGAFFSLGTRLLTSPCDGGRRGRDLVCYLQYVGYLWYQGSFTVNYFHVLSLWTYIFVYRRKLIMHLSHPINRKRILIACSIFMAWFSVEDFDLSLSPFRFDWFACKNDENINEDLLAWACL